MNEDSDGGSAWPADDLTATGLDAGRVGVWRWDAATGEVRWTPNLEEIHGLPRGRFDGTFAFFQNDIHPDDRVRVAEAIDAAMRDGGSYRIEYRLPPQPDGEERWIEARGRVLVRDGGVVGMTGVCQEISEQKLLAQELARTIRYQEELNALMELALREAPLATLFEEVARRLTDLLDADLCKVLELQPSGEEFVLRAGVGWREGLVGVATVPNDSRSQAGYTLTVEHAINVADLAAETRFVPHEMLREHGVVSGMSAIIGGEEGRPFGVLGVHSRRHRRFSEADLNLVAAVAGVLAGAVSRSQAVERQGLLLRELRHRVGNLLTLILSLFNTSARGAQSIDEMREKFSARIMSLSRAHNFIARGGWSTAGLARLVREVLEPYLDRITVEGRDVRVSADAAFAMSMALHELATNAVKHGGLARPEGRVELAWSVRDGRELVIDWTESGAVGVKPPERRGFGSRLVETVIREQIGGDLALDYRPGGLAARISFPMEVLTARSTEEL